MQKNTNRNWSRESCGQVRGTDRQTDSTVRGRGAEAMGRGVGLSASLGDPRPGLPGLDRGSAPGAGDSALPASDSQPGHWDPRSPALLIRGGGRGPPPQ